uniref:cytochrome c oxidase subunit III n=1 Tax=Macrohectopus branickii TaxID=65455 RepID=UPI001D1044E6|nr:cytochrome c oxidase subunit III [Macrohectopus branickii]UCL27459.1 cytochrome c oxidase subunit III [Macrohectopus branickii]
MTNPNHPYHLVEKSPWPFTASVGAVLTTVGLVNMFSSKVTSLLGVGLLAVLLSSAQWWRDICREATFQGLHSLSVTLGLRLGMLLFILSEVLFFFSFFWAFFHSSLAPTMELGAIWPPTSVYPFNPFQTPLLNTAILLASGVTVTWAHHAATENLHLQVLHGLAWTVALGLYFTLLQAMEYQEAPFSLADSVYGSSFFVATGFHGVHVIVGTSFLALCLLRALQAHFSSQHHVGLEAAIWYWHFVDVVWLFLYVSIYWWGS